MIHKYFVTQGTKILFMFWLVLKFRKNEAQWQGGVWGALGKASTRQASQTCQPRAGDNAGL